MRSFWASSASVVVAGTSASAATTGQALRLLLGLFCNRCCHRKLHMSSWVDLVTAWTVSALMVLPRGGHLQGKAASKCVWLLQHPHRHPTALLASSTERGAQLGRLFHRGEPDLHV